MIPEITPSTTSIMTSIQTMQQHSRRLLCYGERDEGDTSLVMVTIYIPAVLVPCLTEHDPLLSSAGYTQHVVQLYL